MGSISAMSASYNNNRKLRGTQKRLKELGPSHVFKKEQELSEEQILKNKKAFSIYSQELQQEAAASSFIKIIHFIGLALSLCGFVWLVLKLGPLFNF